MIPIILPDFDFSRVCNKIVTPISNTCNSASEGVHDAVYPLFVTTCAAMGVLVVAKVALCVAKNRKKFFRSNNDELANLASQESLLGHVYTSGKHRVSNKLEIVDSTITTIGIVYFGVVLAVAAYTINTYTENSCTKLQRSAVDFCENGINAIIDMIINGKKAT